MQKRRNNITPCRVENKTGHLWRYASSQRSPEFFNELKKKMRTLFCELLFQFRPLFRTSVHTHSFCGLFRLKTMFLLLLCTTSTCLILRVNNKIIHLHENISDASPQCFHLVWNPMFLTQCTDQRGHQVVVVAGHRGKQTSETKGTEGIYQALQHPACLDKWGLN